MAIIKCPECGHDVSDKAPVCLYCGVEIAGKYIARPVPTPRPVSRPVVTPAVSENTVTQPQARPVQQTPTPQAQPRPVQQTPTPQAQPRPVQQTPTPQARPVQQTPTPQARPVQQSAPQGQARPVQQATARPQAPKPQPSIYDNGGGGNIITPGGQRPSGSKPKKSHALIYLILFLILVIGGVVLYNAFTNKEGDANKEIQSYKFAMQSEDTKVLQKYLDEYSSAERAHRDSIQSRLTKFSKLQREWDNVVTSNSRSAFEEYAQKHPDSRYRNEALHKVDSIDWSRAKNQDTVEAYDEYLTAHPDGEHTADARRLSTNPGIEAQAPADTPAATATPAPAQKLEVSPDEKTRVDNATTYFFQAINSRDQAKISQKVPQPMTRFLNKTNATSADVNEFAQKLLEGGVTNYNWRIDHNSYVVNKTDLGNGSFEYSTDFKATLSKNTPSGNQQTTYTVSAKVKAGVVTSLTMKKVEPAQ